MAAFQASATPRFAARALPQIKRSPMKAARFTMLNALAGRLVPASRPVTVPELRVRCAPIPARATRCTDRQPGKTICMRLCSAAALVGAGLEAEPVHDALHQTPARQSAL